MHVTAGGALATRREVKYNGIVRGAAKNNAPRGRVIKNNGALSMFTNHLYNLLIQITEEHKSVWRMQEYYIKDAGGCGKCVEFWKKLAADKEAHIRVLEEQIREHLAQNTV